MSKPAKPSAKPSAVTPPNPAPANTVNKEQVLGAWNDLIVTIDHRATLNLSMKEHEAFKARLGIVRAALLSLP